MRFVAPYRPPLGKLHVVFEDGVIRVRTERGVTVKARYRGGNPFTALESLIARVEGLIKAFESAGFRVQAQLRPDGTVFVGRGAGVTVEVFLDSARSSTVVRVQHPGLTEEEVRRGASLAYRYYRVLQVDGGEAVLTAGNAVDAVERAPLLHGILSAGGVEPSDTPPAVEAVLRCMGMSLSPVHDAELARAVGSSSVIQTSVVEHLLKSKVLRFHEGRLLVRVEEGYRPFGDLLEEIVGGHVYRVLAGWRIEERALASVYDTVAVAGVSTRLLDLDDDTLMVVLDWASIPPPPKVVFMRQRRGEVVSAYVKRASPRQLLYMLGAPLYRRFLSDSDVGLALARLSETPQYLTELFYNYYPHAITDSPEELTLSRVNGVPILRKGWLKFMVSYAEGLDRESEKVFSVFMPTRDGLLLPVHVRGKTIEGADLEEGQKQVRGFEKVVELARKYQDRVWFEVHGKGRIVLGITMTYTKRGVPHIMSVSPFKRPIAWGVVYRALYNTVRARRRRAVEEPRAVERLAQEAG